MKSNVDRLIIKEFQNKYQISPKYLISAPGRVNLIGEHTDYSEGFVLPVAINLSIYIAMSPSESQIVDVYSMDYDEHIDFHLKKLKKNNDNWEKYIKGVAWAMLDEGIDLNGWNAVMTGNIPIGAGLSSSAALEVAVVKAFCLSGSYSLSPVSIAEIGKKAECSWVGVNVGIMDQLISAAGRQGHAMKLDCRTKQMEYVPIPSGISFFVLDTMTRRELSNSDYNTRHEEVISASRILGVSLLRDATLDQLAGKKATLPDTLYRRAKHVITENLRVHAFSQAMRRSDLIEMGKLINKSHASLRDDFQVSSKELNLIVNIAQNDPACLGARMTGAGFGGCALAVIKDKNTDAFIRNVSNVYSDETGLKANIFKVNSAQGVAAKHLNL